MVLHARPAARLHDPRVHVGEGPVDLVPLLHAGLLDLHDTLLPEVLVPPSDIFNFAPMDPRANIACAVLALAADVALFAYWLYKIVVFRRNPITGVLYCELGEFRTIVREHCDDRDKYFLVDRIPETPEELGFEPDSPILPADGYAAWMPWWRGEDRRHLSKRPSGSRP